ncbi:hypothetical protein IMZ48_12150 [Candidatus Bathyarchaeota archaeon]|nr:hypothetical protein [Candidatus Bathyarchaeota archaeon]
MAGWPATSLHPHLGEAGIVQCGRHEPWNDGYGDTAAQPVFASAAA